MGKQLSIIVAVGNDLEIGKDNDLLWQLSDDLKRFKRLTSGHTVIMGRNTWESLPFKPLPKRKNIVITDVEGEQFEGAEIANSIEEAIAMADDQQESFIMGGGSIYKQFLPLAQRLYITEVKANFDADTWFPKFNSEDYEVIDSEFVAADEKNQFDSEYKLYQRK